MTFDELSKNAKYHAMVYFNSNDEYGVNGTGEYRPMNFEDMSAYADACCWIFDENGDRMYEEEEREYWRRYHEKYGK